MALAPSIGALHGALERSYAASARPSYAAAQPLSTCALPRADAPLLPQPVAPHLDCCNFSGLTAFHASPRRDPLSRRTHIETLSATGRISAIARSTPHGCSSLLPGCLVPERFYGSWETDVARHSQREPLRPGTADSSGPLDGAAGASHPNLGQLGSLRGGSDGLRTSAHFSRLTAGYSEEERRQFLLTGERSRRNAAKRWAPTNTLGTGAVGGGPGAGHMPRY